MGYKFSLHPETFTISVTNKPIANCFACIHFDGIYTVVHKDPLPDVGVLKGEGGWSMFTIDAAFDFSVTGVIAEISTKLADHGIPVFVISSYYTDHILIKNEHRKVAIVCFESNNWVVNSEVK